MGLKTYSDKKHEVEDIFNSLTDQYEYREMKRVDALIGTEEIVDVAKEWITSEHLYQDYWSEIAKIAKEKIGEVTLQEELDEPDYVPYLEAVKTIATRWQEPKYANSIILKKLDTGAKQYAFLVHRRPFDTLYGFPKDISVNGVKKYIEMLKEKQESKCIIL